MAPPSPAKMKMLAPETPPWPTAKPSPPLKTMPVGFALPPWPGGTATTSDCGTPLPSYSVDVAVALSATQTNPCGLNAMPQPLTRWLSTFGPLYGLVDALTSDTRLVATKCVLVLPMVAPVSEPPPPQAATHS